MVPWLAWLKDENKYSSSLVDLEIYFSQQWIILQD